MENASKALIISAEILIGILLLSFMVFAFRSMGMFSQTVEEGIQMKNVQQFNAQFTTFEGRKDLTAQEVITLGNLAKEYNKTEEGKLTNNQIKVRATGIESKYTNVQAMKEEDTYEFIQSYTITKKATFTCNSITYQQNTGKVSRIEIKLNT